MSKGQRVQKTSFAMPLIPESIPMDPTILALLHCAAFLELSEDDAVDPDGAVEAMEHVAAYLQRLSPAQVDAFRLALAQLEEYGAKHGFSEELLEFLRDFLDNSGVGEQN